MTAGSCAVVITLPWRNFGVFLGCFLFMFVATGVGNGATYRMIPAVFAARAADPASSDRSGGDAVSHQRKASAALGLIAALGAYGGFVIPQILNASHRVTGGYGTAFLGFAAGYLLLAVMTAAVYVGGRAGLHDVRV